MQFNKRYAGFHGYSLFTWSFILFVVQNAQKKGFNDASALPNKSAVSASIKHSTVCLFTVDIRSI